MLISTTTLHASIRDRKCAIGSTSLDEHEFVVGREKFPRLYDGGKDDKEISYTKELLPALNSLLADQDFFRNFGDYTRKFLLLLNSNGYFRSERSLHIYVYNFWQQLWLSSEDELFLSEAYYEGNHASGATLFARSLMPAISTDEIRIDIVGLGGPHGKDLYIIEMKAGELDDRAVGQILRYYSHVREQCDRLFHDCDIRRVIPLLVVKKVRLEFWSAIPLHFRELLQIFFYDIDSGSGRIVLKDAKAALSTQARHRRFA